MTVVAKGIKKAYDDVPLFEVLSLTVNPNERLGIIGPNGVGKSTLLNCLCGLEQPDTGSVTITGELGYSWQQPDSEITVLNYLSQVNGDVLRLGLDLDGLYLRMAAEGNTQELEDLVATTQDAFERHNGWNFPALAQEVLSRLGLEPDINDRQLGELSGGQASRVMLAAQLLAKPANLFLDEPTNNLDTDGLEWLASYLDSYTGSVILVSHDREFLDATATNILEIDGLSSTPTLYPGNYTAFETQKRAALERLAMDYKAQQKFVARIEGEIASKRDVAQRLNSTSKNDFYRSKAARVDRQWKAQRGRLERLLESVRAIARPETLQTRPFHLRTSQQSPAIVADISVQELRYCGRNEPTLRDVGIVVRRGERVAITGANGTGKSTLLRALMGDPAVEVAGTMTHCPNTGYLEQSQASYDTNVRVIDFFRDGVIATEDDARAVLRWYGFDATQPFQPMSLLSPGERARVVIAKLVYGGADLLVLDEPTNHLDIDGMKQLESALTEYEGALLVVSHDRRFLSNVGFDTELRIADSRVAPVPISSRAPLPVTLGR